MYSVHFDPGSRLVGLAAPNHMADDAASILIGTSSLFYFAITSIITPYCMP